jgi:hypothetical protein
LRALLKFEVRELERFVMGSHKKRVCLWSDKDLEDYRDRKIVPSCNLHEHISRDEALTLVQTLLYTYRDHEEGKTKFVYEAVWVDPSIHSKIKAIVFTNPKEWQIKDSGLTKADSVPVHQLAKPR